MGLTEDLARVALQERELVLPRFDAEVAWSLGIRLRTMSQERGLAVVIDVRRFDQPLFYAALEGTTPDNPDWVRRKINVVARFRRSSYRVGLSLEAKHETLQDKLGLPVSEFAPNGGSFPLTVAGAGIVGCVTVSGLPQRDDHELVVEALCAELGRDYAELRLERQSASASAT